jgi:hypothetical protein
MPGSPQSHARETGQMAQSARGTFDAGPRKAARPAPIMSGMQNASPIRRYVLLRQRDGAPATSRWSLERIAAGPRPAHAPAVAPVRSARAARR